MISNRKKCCSSNKKLLAAFIFILAIIGFTIFWCKRFGCLSQSFSTKNLSSDVIPCLVIGGGVGGLTSAIYLSQLGCKTVVLQGDLPGGALSKTKSIQNWPGIAEIEGAELVKNLEDHAKKCGAILLDSSAVSVDFSKWPFSVEIPGKIGSKTEVINALSCIVATGATPNKLEIPGETEFWGRGVTNCAICDAPMFKDGTVAVVGGGDSAIVEVEILSAVARKIYLIVRSGALRAKGDRVEKIKQNPKIEILYSTKIEKVFGDDQGVHGILVKTKDQNSLKIQLDGLFLAIGSNPNTAIFSKHLKLSRNGLIKLFNDQETSVKGVFAIGDVCDGKYRQAVTAAGTGCVAAIQALNFLNHKNIDLSAFSKTAKGELSQADDETEQKTEEAPAESIEEMILELNEDSTESDLMVEETKNLAENNSSDSSDELIIEVESQNQIQKQIQKTGRPYVLDLYAPWCMPCQMMHPIFEKLASKFKGKITFFRADVDKSPGLLTAFGVKGVPTFIFFDKDGSIKDRVYGQIVEDDLTDILNNLLN